MTKDLKIKSMTKKNVRRPNSNNDKNFHEYIVKEYRVLDMSQKIF